MILLDTHVWVWWVNESSMASNAMLRIIQEHQGDGLGVSIISCWEVAKLVERGRLELTIPVERWPEQALSALEPKRVVIQLAEGLMYRFTLPVCAGREFLQDEEKRVVPYETAEQVRAWFSGNAAQFGVKPLMLDVSMRTLRFPHGQQRFKVQHAVLEGALEVAHAERLRRRILKGFGYYRRAGLGMLQLSA